MRTKLWTVVATGILAAATLATAGDAPKVSITVYNQNIGLVREERTLTLKKGVQEYLYDGVASEIDPTSVLFHADGVSALEQNYEFDLVDRNALMTKYIGKTVDVQLESEMAHGRLLSTSGGIILQNKDGEVRLIDPSAVKSVRFPELPDGLILKPTLRWLLDARTAGDVHSELTYITGQLNWTASYVAVIDAEDKNLEWSGWMELTNKSGATYRDATLKLIAGDVNVERRRRPAPIVNDVMFAARGTANKGFEEKSFYEYHMYTLPRPVTIHDNQIKQIMLVDPTMTPVKKLYIFNPNKKADKVAVHLRFRNEKKGGLGIPLPAGKVRVYKNDSDGSQQFIGEDRIDHTPRDEKVELFTGYAFDITPERTQMDRKQLASSTVEVVYKIELRNHKDAGVDVIVRENFGGDWQMMSAVPEGKKINASRYEWTVPVPANGSTTIDYRVRIH